MKSQLLLQIIEASAEVWR